MGYAVDFDGQLYNGLSIGKAEAFASVFDRYHRLLYALAYRYLKSGPEAEGQFLPRRWLVQRAIQPDCPPPSMRQLPHSSLQAAPPALPASAPAQAPCRALPALPGAAGFAL